MPHHNVPDDIPKVIMFLTFKNCPLQFIFRNRAMDSPHSTNMPSIDAWESFEIPNDQVQNQVTFGSATIPTSPLTRRGFIGNKSLLRLYIEKYECVPVVINVDEETTTLDKTNSRRDAVLDAGRDAGRQAIRTPKSNA